MATIKTHQWKPIHDTFDYPPEFVDWIDSINSDFRGRKTYEPYELYCQQADQWLKNAGSITKYKEIEDQAAYINREQKRCRQNTLYANERRLYLKEGTEMQKDGRIKFKAWEAQKIVLFILDCGYNAIMGKARQIGLTSVLGGAAVNKINVSPSFFVKFVTHSKEKGEEIFEDKIKYAFTQYEPWFKQDVHNDSLRLLGLKSKTVKGEAKGANSKIQVSAPAVNAISGGSPDLVYIDEIGEIPMFTKIMKNGRPTLYAYNPETSRQEMRRQILAWGTGGLMDGAGAVFESEFKAAIKAWAERNFNYGMIPIFFNAYARAGITDKILEQEKKNYYSVTGPEAEESKIMYHQHYPITIDDMFLRTSRTILPMAEINKHIARIFKRMNESKNPPQFGYFEPVFDQTNPLNAGDTPYGIKRATFIPTTGMEDPRTTAVILEHPKKGWKHRYYQGTDPLNSETGHSNMASSIRDGLENKPVCVVNCRHERIQDSFMQCILAGMYYSVDKELIENNIGDWYFNYCKEKGLRRAVANKALHPTLRTASEKAKWWGISNKANTAGRITNKTIEMLDLYANKNDVLWFWLQTKTFVEKTLAGQQQIRQTRYQASDTRYDYDDVIYSETLSYICTDTFMKHEPVDEGIDAKGERKKKPRKKFIQDERTGWEKRLCEVDGEGKLLRFVSQGGRRPTARN